MDGRREGRETDEDGAAERDMDWELEAGSLLARSLAGWCVWVGWAIVGHLHLRRVGRPWSDE